MSDPMPRSLTLMKQTLLERMILHRTSTSVESFLHNELDRHSGTYPDRPSGNLEPSLL